MIQFNETKSDYNIPVGFLVIASIVMLSIIGLIRNSQPTFDYPEEFNKYNVSRDRANPTEMMVFYDTLNNKYIFEFMDK
jgi:hypothetical protein